MIFKAFIIHFLGDTNNDPQITPDIMVHRKNSFTFYFDDGTLFQT